MSEHSWVLEPILELEKYAQEQDCAGLLAGLHTALEVYAIEASPNEEVRSRTLEFLRSKLAPTGADEMQC